MIVIHSKKKEVWVYFKTETDVDPSISSRLLNDETYAVNYIPYDYKATFAVYTNSIGLGTVSPVGTVLMNRDNSIVVTVTPAPTPTPTVTTSTPT